MKIWVKIDRLSAWVLFASMLAYFITGYGITKGIISPAFSSQLHLDILPIISLVAFTLHTGFAIQLAFKRWRIWNNLSATVLVLFFITFLSSFLYIDRFYQPQKQKSGIETPLASSSPASATAQTQSAAGQTSTIFSVTELQKCDGQNGQPAYVAVDGTVYDLTNVFRSGTHFSHFAGTDLTGEFYSYHAKSALSKYPIVGRLE